ncbi:MULTISPECIES: PKD domain-containing protein [Flavobacteriaceae]|uniref:PKD domain-containing protein n=1 Tax=Gaetbulibacter jejuensis TaxID=584607 RepID=A0ABN1JGW6_9FLAO|nr:PKD domain-containing protein [Meridianimaribacter sp. CL38]TBV27850.1 PKD domain-containing protein [Meridianimaribacter sp. CL38]
MKNILNKTNGLIKIACVIGITVFSVSCDDYFEFDLPESNSIEDTIFPTADFSYMPDVGDFTTIHFTDLSTESNTFFWDFGTGDTSNEQDPVYTFADGEGTYTVSLTASDSNGVSDTVTYDIEVVEPEAIIPVILEAGFEDNTLPDGSGDGRDSWRNSDLGGVIQITGSPVYEGSQASKYPSAGDRVAYQELVVSSDTDYSLSYYYTLKDDSPGSITVYILPGGGYTDLATAKAAAIASFEGTDQTDPDIYVSASVNFNTGSNTMVSILVHNEGVEARIDSFEIDVN